MFSLLLCFYNFIEMLWVETDTESCQNLNVIGKHPKDISEIFKSSLRSIYQILEKKKGTNGLEGKWKPLKRWHSGKILVINCNKNCIHKNIRDLGWSEKGEKNLLNIKEVLSVNQESVRFCYTKKYAYLTTSHFLKINRIQF